MKKLSSWCAALLMAMLSQTSQADILIGQTAGFTGIAAPGVKEITDGAKLYINAINARGGVNGQKIDLISMDDKFDPELAGENARILIEEENVVAMFLSRGTPQTQAIIPHLNKYGVPLIAPSTGALLLQRPAVKHVFNVRATYQREAEKVVAYLTSIGMTRIALVYVDDTFGLDGATGAQKSLANAKLKPVVFEKFNRANPDFSAITPKIVKADAQAIVMVATAGTVVEGIKTFRAAGSTAQLVTLSNNASLGFVKSLGSNAAGVIISQVFPSERSSSYQMVREAQEMAKANGLIQLTPATLEGFAGAKVLVEALRRAGAKPTREKVQAALENIRKFDLGGLEIDYSPTDHSGLNFADLSIVGVDGKFKR